jgi:hypothetical protein
MLHRITHHCPRKNGEKEDLQAIFDSKVAKPAHLQRAD